MMSLSPSESASSKEVVFHCEHAPSGRAKCRVCLNSISQGTLRLAVSMPSAEPSLPDPQNEKVTRQRRIAAEAPQWCHANCFRKFRASAKWWRTHMDLAARWIGFSELSPAEQAQVRRFVEACQKGEDPPHFSVDTEPTNSSDRAHTRKHQRKYTSGEAPMAEKEETDGSRTRKEERSHLELKGKLSSSLAGKGWQSRKRTQITPGKDDGSKVPSHRRKKDQSEDGKAESQPSQPKNAGGERKRKKKGDEEMTEMAAKYSISQESAGKESIGLALTDREQQNIEEQLEKAEKETVATLRSLLRMNNQKISGPKEELAHRVAECRVLGAIPKCPQCHVGFLRFDGSKKEYRCPGYVNEDGEYERCPFTCTDIKRLPWKE
eukprot:XP_028343320.1 poly [ADP-ribose] polymerase 1-like [Physeter catodon]